MSPESIQQPRIPVLLLKTKSSPRDNYEEYFSTLDNNRFNPVFIPVLEHQHNTSNLSYIQSLLQNGSFYSPQLPTPTSTTTTYGGLIFTSQRAVEAFLTILPKDTTTTSNPLPSSLPIYVVGPATARSLSALHLPCPILGESSGNGEDLARFIQSDYPARFHSSSSSSSPSAAIAAAATDNLPPLPTLLFLVGDKRRDIIPTVLTSAGIPITELEVYQTGELSSFRSSFSSLYHANLRAGVHTQWVVIFSPTGCRALLAELGLIDFETGVPNPLAVAAARQEKRVLIVTIGPTTRDYLRKEFSIEPDVVAETPSPEGVGAAMEALMLRS